VFFNINVLTYGSVYLVQELVKISLWFVLYKFWTNMIL